jgi:hypothetical protein
MSLWVRSVGRDSVEPNLKGWFVLIKDAQYNTALPTKLTDGTPIPFAELKWDKELLLIVQQLNLLHY